MIQTASLLAAAPAPLPPAAIGAPAPEGDSGRFSSALEQARATPPARPTNDTKDGAPCVDGGEGAEEPASTPDPRLRKTAAKAATGTRQAGPAGASPQTPAGPTLPPDCEMPASGDGADALARDTRAHDTEDTTAADVAVDLTTLLAQLKKPAPPPIKCPGPATPASAAAPSTSEGPTAARGGRGGPAATATTPGPDAVDVRAGARAAGDAARTDGAEAVDAAAAPGAEAAAEPVRGFAAELHAALPPGALGAAAPATTAATAAPTSAEGRLTAAPGSPEFAQQLGAQISTFIKDGIQNARLELHPVEMGPLTVQIQLDGQAAQVNMAAEHAGTRQALEQAMPQLAGSLREAGLTLSGGGVFEQPRQNPQDPGAPQGDTRSERNVRRGAAAAAAIDPLPAAVQRHRGVVDLVA